MDGILIILAAKTISQTTSKWMEENKTYSPAKNPLTRPPTSFFGGKINFPKNLQMDGRK